MTYLKYIVIGAILLFASCVSVDKTPPIIQAKLPTTSPTPLPDTTVYTTYSTTQKSYKCFTPAKAINRISEMENEYFRQYENGISRYYGTIWRETAGDSFYQSYLAKLGTNADSMHCTIYAVKALEAGMDTAFQVLEKAHRNVYKNHEHAGWSIGYLLVKEFGWKAYLIIDRDSEEFEHCRKAFLQQKSYPVWRQPDIPLEAMYVRHEQDSLIQNLLKSNEFGWGFSRQGIHTWITRYDILKECNWSGSPCKDFELSSLPLFLKTPFLAYDDYASHIVVFPQ